MVHRVYTKGPGLFCEAKLHILGNMEKILKSYENIDAIKETTESILAADNVFVYGAGRSGMIGRAFAMRLVQLNLKCFFIGESTTPIVTSRDIVIILSRTGETYSALQTANIVRRLGTKLVVITGRKGSKLSHVGNIVHHLTLGPGDKKSKLAPLGTVFEITALLFLDCIVAELMSRMGESEETMMSRHAIWV